MSLNAAIDARIPTVYMMFVMFVIVLNIVLGFGLARFLKERHLEIVRIKSGVEDVTDSYGGFSIPVPEEDANPIESAESIAEADIDNLMQDVQPQMDPEEVSADNVRESSPDAEVVPSNESVAQPEALKETEVVPEPETAAEEEAEEEAATDPEPAESGGFADLNSISLDDLAESLESFPIRDAEEEPTDELAAQSSSDAFSESNTDANDPTTNNEAVEAVDTEEKLVEETKVEASEQNDSSPLDEALDTSADDLPKQPETEDAEQEVPANEVSESIDSKESAEAAESTEASEEESPEDRATSVVQEALSAIDEELALLNESIFRADDTFRSSTESDSPDTGSIEECLASLKEATEKFQANRDQHVETFEKVDTPVEGMEQLREQLGGALKNQDKQIESTGALLESFNVNQNDLSAGCKRLLGETNKLLKANHRIRDTVDTAAQRIDVHSNKIDDDMKSGGKLPCDKSTGLLNSAGFDMAIKAHWEKDVYKQQPSCMAVLDIDLMQQVNEKKGNKTGDAVIVAVGKSIKEIMPDAVSSSRIAGQQFGMFMTDVDLREAILLIERVRQTIDATTFVHEGEDVNVTVSVGLVKVAEKDDLDSMYDRADDTVREAKRYGRNRTFQNDGDYPAPVILPNLSIDDQTVEI